MQLLQFKNSIEGIELENEQNTLSNRKRENFRKTINKLITVIWY